MTVEEVVKNVEEYSASIVARVNKDIQEIGLKFPNNLTVLVAIREQIIKDLKEQNQLIRDCVDNEKLKRELKTAQEK